ncbi:O-antigen ligase family protein [Niveispirillum fermenti]|uniref:O-antigen ligase family protein n=1 Tax=Niveispirillum fermenti TaxID=1233113 RepID=UPI00404236E7
MHADKGGHAGAPVIVFIIGLGIPLLAAVVPLAPLGMAPGMVALSVFALMACLWRERRLPLPDPLILTGLGLFIAWTGLGLSWTGAMGRALESWAAFLYVFVPGLFFLTALGRLAPDRARQAARWLLPAAVFGAILFTLELIGDQPIQHLASPGKTDLNLERDINRAAVLLALLAGPVSLLMWRLGQRVPAVLALAGALVLTMFSTSELAVAFLLALLLLLALGYWSVRLAAGLVATGIVLGLAFCGQAAQWMTRAGLPQAEWLPASSRHRMMTWNFVAENLDAHPWRGWGLEASRVIPGGEGIFPGTLNWPVLPIHPHSLFLQIRLELGWIGALAAGFLLLVVLRRLTRLDPSIRAMAVALFGASILMQSFAYGAWQAWILCGMLFAGAVLALAGRVRGPS